LLTVDWLSRFALSLYKNGKIPSINNQKSTVSNKNNRVQHRHNNLSICFLKRA